LQIIIFVESGSKLFKRFLYGFADKVDFLEVFGILMVSREQ